MDEKPKGTMDSFKEEILEYGYFDINTFTKDILCKVDQFIQTKTAKAMKDRWDEPISSEHLISIILYTDFTELSSIFSASFRQKNPFEHKQQVNKRNNKYWFWSKKLKEVLYKYGQRKSEGLFGPFYTGMSWVMTVPQFNIYLYSPTSTSIHIEIAMRFCGQSGMILQFDNSEGAAQDTYGYDCSWLSRYKEEDERYHLFLFYICLFINIDYYV